MNDFDKEIGNALRKGNHFDSKRGEKLRKEIIQMFDEKLKKVERITWMWIVGTVIVAMMAGSGFSIARDTQGLILFAGLFFIAILTQVLIKLWYWIMNCKLSVLKEIKQLELQVAELKEKNKT